jgi:hypothetical protein
MTSGLKLSNETVTRCFYQQPHEDGTELQDDLEPYCSRKHIQMDRLLYHTDKLLKDEETGSASVATARLGSAQGPEPLIRLQLQS